MSQGMEVPIFNLNETCHECWDQPKTQFEEEKFLRGSTLLEIGGGKIPPFQKVSVRKSCLKSLFTKISSKFQRMVIDNY